MDTDYMNADDYGMDGYERQGVLATPADAVREWVHNVGRENPDQAWFCSNYDTWEKNPFYAGPPVRHPEDDSEDYADANEPAREGSIPAERDDAPFFEEGEGPGAVRTPVEVDYDDGIPF
jgi:hypothetical protein